MIWRFYAIASELDSNLRFLLKIRKTEYRRMRLRIIKMGKLVEKDKKKKKKTVRKYPILTRRSKGKRIGSYVVFGIIKELKIEDIKPLDLNKLTTIKRR